METKNSTKNTAQAAQTHKMLLELRNFIIKENYINLNDFICATLEHEKFKNIAYQTVALLYTSTLDKYCAANYKKMTNGGDSKKYKKATKSK